MRYDDRLRLTSPSCLDIEDPILKISLSVRIALVFTAVLLMNAKPQLRESLTIVGAAVILGLAAASLIPNRGSVLSTANSDAGS